MEAIQLLKDDHKKVEKIFSDLENKRDDRRALFPELDRELTIHAEIERSEEHTSELQSQSNLVCRLLLEKKKIALDDLGPLAHDCVHTLGAPAYVRHDTNIGHAPVRLTPLLPTLLRHVIASPHNLMLFE